LCLFQPAVEKRKSQASHHQKKPVARKNQSRLIEAQLKFFLKESGQPATDGKFITGFKEKNKSSEPEKL